MHFQNKSFVDFFLNNDKKSKTTNNARKIEKTLIFLYYYCKISFHIYKL